MSNFLRSYSNSIIWCNVIFSFLILPFSVFAQLSKHGTKTFSSANTIVNEYTSLTANANAGDSAIVVANSVMNDNTRFGALPGGRLIGGDLIMIIQMQGASINGSPNGNISTPDDSTWGAVTNYNNCGNWEILEVRDVPSSNIIRFDCKLKNSYSVAGKTQIVRIPRYSDLTVTATGEITCDPWDGTIGGVLAIESQGNITIQAGGKIDATGKGFRGGKLLENNSSFGINNVSSILTDYGAEKGESIAGFQATYDTYGGRYGKGAPANGGGGGTAQNGGGGGGANAGNVNTWNGYGIPDLTGSYTNAWNLEFANRAAISSSGGGRGGYTYSLNNQDALTTVPGNVSWGGDNRRVQGGFGGRPLDYSTGKIFLGGGGGAGDQDNSEGGQGGNGGGIIYLYTYSSINGNGQIISNGADGANSSGVPSSSGYAGRDGAGGGGGGGTIILNSVSGASGVSASANGGKGGNQSISKGASYVGSVNEAEGPGGGGGGGYIALSSGSITQSVSGGNNGTTNSDALTEFLPNGATKGGLGISNQSITNFFVSAQNDTICSGESATLFASISGNPPAGTLLYWYSVGSGGSPVASGNTFTTPILTAPPNSRFYFVGTCPSSYRLTVRVTVVPPFTVNAGPDVSKCPNDNIQLTATGANTYSWSPTTGLSNANIANPMCSVTTTTTYVVTGTINGCTNTDTATVTVNSGFTPDVSISASQNGVCSGTNITFNATPTNGGPTPSYQWKVNGANVGTNSDVFSTSTLNNGDVITCVMTSSLSGCLTSTTATSNSIVMNISSPSTTSVTISATPNPVCAGSNITFTASVVNGGSTPAFQWKVNGVNAGLNQNTFSSNSLSNGNVVSCEMTSSAVCVTPIPAMSNNITVTVTPLVTPSVTISASQTSFCAGTNVTFNATVTNGGTTPAFQWKVNGANMGTNSNTFSSASLNNGDVITCELTSNAACVSPANVTSNSITVTVSSSVTPAVSISASQTTFCAGTNVTFNATVTNGGSTPAFQWKVNSANVGTNSNTFSSASLNNGDVITCVLTSNANCASPSSATSNSISVTVTATVTPSVTISASQTAICPGATVSFSASASNQGTTPVFQWKINGVNVGANADTFSSTSLNNGDVIICELTSNANCVNPNTVVSNSVSVTVNSNANPQISISASQINICSGTNIVFTASIINGGSNPIFQWMINGNPTGNNSSSFSSTSIADSSVIKCILTSNNPCVSNNTVESDSIVISVTQSFSPTVFISATTTSVCEGTSAGFKAIARNTGPNPQILWFVNGNSTGDNDDSYSSSGLNDGDQVVVRVTSTAPCASPQEVYDTVTISIIPSPVADAGTDIILCRNDSVQLNGSGGVNYQWIPDIGLNNSSIPNPLSKPNSTIEYILIVMGANGCLDKDTVTVFVDTCSGVYSIEKNIPVVYPNPSFDIFNLDLNSMYQNADFYLFDITGKLIYSGKGNFSSLNEKRIIDLSNFSSGTYYLQIILGINTYRYKLSKL
jgi:hypothetical protein